MRPSKDIANLQKIFTIRCVMRLFEATFNTKNTTFNYSYSNAAKFKR